LPSTCFLSLSELVFETLPVEILSFLTRTLFSLKPSPLPPSLGAASVAQTSPAGHSLCLCLQSTLAALQAGAQSQRGFRRALFLPPCSLSAPPPPFVNALVPFTCLVLPSAAWSRAGARGQRSAQRALVLPFAASSSEHRRAGLWRFGQGQTICLCNFYLQWDSWKTKASATILAHSLALPPFLLLSPLLVNPPSLPLFLLSSIHPLQTTH
jgi:hypothetical protein